MDMKRLRETRYVPDRNGYTKTPQTRVIEVTVTSAVSVLHEEVPANTNLHDWADVDASLVPITSVPVASGEVPNA